MSQVARFAAVAISIAAAIPTGGTSLLAAGVASAGVASGATAALVAAGITAAANIGAGLLAKKPSIGSSGRQTDWNADPTAPIPITVGRTGGGGYIVYRKASGSGDQNEYQTITTVLSLGPIDAIEASYADKRLLNLTGTAAGAPYSNWMWEDRQLGLCPEAAALNTGTGNKPGWTSGHILSGLAAVQNTLRYDSRGDGTFMTEPQMLWVRRGVLCYDPRLDSTFPGGSGSHRIDNQATWEYSNNPFIVGLSYALGWFQNGKRRGGVGMPFDSIDIASAVECAEIADLNGWKVGGNISTGDNKWAALKAILQAGGGEPIRDGAMLSFIVQAPRVSIAAIGAGDLIGKASVPRSRRRKERINWIIPKYRSEAHWWTQVDGTVARIAEHVTEDGEERTRTIEYPLVQVEDGDDVSQPTQLAGYDVELSRERMPITLPLKLRWIGYRVGDCITCDIEELGLTDVQLIVIGRQLNAATGAVTLTVRTEDPGKHARVFALTGDLPPTTEFERPDRPGQYSFNDGSVQIAIATSYPVGLEMLVDDTGQLTINDHTRRYTDGYADVSVTGAVIATGLAAGDFRAVGYDDFDRLGGAVTYQLFEDDLDARATAINPGRHYVGYFIVPTAGSPPSGGGGASPPGGNCVTTDTPILMADRSEKPAGELVAGDKLFTRHELRLDHPLGGWGVFQVEAVEFVESEDIWEATIGGKVLRATGGHKVWTGEWQEMREIGVAVGSGTVAKIRVTDAHTYVSNGILSHNLKSFEDEI